MLMLWSATVTFYLLAIKSSPHCRMDTAKTLRLRRRLNPFHLPIGSVVLPSYLQKVFLQSRPLNLRLRKSSRILGKSSNSRRLTIVSTDKMEKLHGQETKRCVDTDLEECVIIACPSSRLLQSIWPRRKLNTFHFTPTSAK
jgi:hypothetical protein